MEHINWEAGGVQLSSKIFWWTLAGRVRTERRCVGSLGRANPQPSSSASLTTDSQSGLALSLLGTLCAGVEAVTTR
jgi:hypothetical protein